MEKHQWAAGIHISGLRIFITGQLLLLSFTKLYLWNCCKEHSTVNMNMGDEAGQRKVVYSRNGGAQQMDVLQKTHTLCQTLKSPSWIWWWQHHAEGMFFFWLNHHWQRFEFLTAKTGRKMDEMQTWGRNMFDAAKDVGLTSSRNVQNRLNQSKFMCLNGPVRN